MISLYNSIFNETSFNRRDAYLEKKIKTSFSFLFSETSYSDRTSLASLDKTSSDFKRFEIKTNIAFFELTKRMFKLGSTDVVDQVAKVAFIEKLKLYDGREDDLFRLVKALEQGKLNDPAFQNLDDMAHLALWGVWKGYIDTTCFSNLMIVRIGLIYYDNLTFIPLFNHYGINQEAKKIIEETNDSHLLASSELNVVFKNLENNTSIPFLLLGTEKARPTITTISEAINTALKSNFLNRTADKKFKILSSINLLQAVVSVRSNDPGFKLNPVIGFSSYDQISNNALFAMRDSMVFFPNIKVPTSADGNSAYGFDFLYHDGFYHSMTSSSCDRQMQTTFVFISHVLSTLKFDARHEKIKISLIKRFSDMEVALARREVWLTSFYDNKKNRLDLFLTLFKDFLVQSIERNSIKEEMESDEFNKYSIVLTALFMHLLEIKNKGNHWDEELGLDLSLIEKVRANQKTRIFDFKNNALPSESVLYNALKDSGLISYFKSLKINKKIKLKIYSLNTPIQTSFNYRTYKNCFDKSSIIFLEILNKSKLDYRFL